MTSGSEEIDLENGIRRFNLLVPAVGDILVIILKGHLLIEEQLESIITAAVKNPQKIREARLTFAQRLKLVEAIVGHIKKTSVIWEATGALNSIRNRLVHVAEPAVTEELLSPFFAICEKEKDWAFPDVVSLPRGATKLHIYIRYIWINFDVLHQVVREIRKVSPIP